MKDWEWLFPIDRIEIVKTTCLGDVIFIDSEGILQILDVVAGEVRIYDLKEEEQVNNMPNLIARLESQGLKLKEGQCYGLKPHAIFKEYVAENVYVASLSEYVSWAGDFHRQIKDVPDGGKIRIEVLNWKTIQ